VANFALILVHGPSWDESVGIREQGGWEEHAAFMDGLVEDGFILVGGPVGDRRQTMHLVEAEPWARGRLLEIGSIDPWSLWLDFRNTDGGR
jgi:hypothetical protein